MELTGQQTISLPIEKVWAALNDPAVLQQCIPGCDTFEQSEANQYNVAMTATVGPVKARFTGKLVLSDINPPTSYNLKFDGTGGAAGAGKGTANVQLAEAPEGTLLRYTVGATVTGRLAQVGARLIDGVAKKMADQFFTRFKSILQPSNETAMATDTPDHSEPATKPALAPGNNSMKWASAVAIVIAVAVGLYAFTR